MQPLQCVLQHLVPIHAAITMRFASACCRTPRENRLCPKRSKPHPPHSRGTFHRRLHPLYTEKRKVSCAGFLPKTNPMQQSCSHYIAFCNNTCSNPHVSTHMATKPDKTLAPPDMTNVLLCDVKFHTALHECIFM